MSEPQFIKLRNLAAAKFGATTIYATDDFFAEKENLLKEGRGIFIADKYTDRGKWMDGWESRRKRTAGHDYCIVRLGAMGIIQGLDIDTNHFLGNHPPFAAVEACSLPLTASEEEILKHDDWTEILPKSALNPGSQHFFEIESEEVYTYVKLHIYPDGGVARLKVYGEVYTDWDSYKNDNFINLASANLGAKSVLCNDMFFSHMDNLLMPNRGANMGDGWETKRNRTPNNRDWVVLQLAKAGTLCQVLVDTCHFKGNYPDTCSIDAINLDSNSFITAENVDSLPWVEVLPKQKLQADFEHFFDVKNQNTTFTHIRLNIYPDGGVSRLRVMGYALV